MKKSNDKLLKLCYASTFAALIFCATMIHIGIGFNGGYIHLGDAVIYLAASLLPAPYAVSAAAVGAGLADIAAGAPAWVLATVLIKAASALFFTSKKSTILCPRNYIALFTGALLCVGGYYISEVLIYSCGFVIPLASIPFNLIQTVASAVIYLSMSVILDKASIKKHI